MTTSTEVIQDQAGIEVVNADAVLLATGPLLWISANAVSPASPKPCAEGRAAVRHIRRRGAA
ncbi:MAG TPA: hypothetical protein VME44_12935 [Streptosporangiaceae bacterium]|nr:hypothetical protein [Streptosporangiaceae bacterium]